MISDYLPRGCKDMDEIEAARRAITLNLRDFSGFEAVAFCDVGARGIQINGKHKRVECVIFPLDNPTIKYDLSNIEECVAQFCENWRKDDNEESLKEYNALSDDIKQYGSN